MLAKPPAQTGSSPIRSPIGWRATGGGNYENGAPWLFGTDDPGQLSRRLGWSASVTDIAEPGNRYNRWYAPVTPMDVADAPRGYFVEAVK